jgi:hypothetical protein
MYTFLEYLKMKHLFGSATLFEVRLLLDGPGVLKDALYLDCLRAKISEIPIETLLRRLRFLQELQRRQPWSLNLYHTYSGCVKYEIQEVRIPIRKVKKYSGYVRTPSAVGSKSRKGGSRVIPETDLWFDVEELDFYGFLTVGKFSGSVLEIFSPEDEQISSKR